MNINKQLSFDKREGKIWHDGKFVEWKNANIHILTHGLHYASCIYEGERVYKGTVFKLREHTDRLFESARILDMVLPYSKIEIQDATKKLLSLNNIKEGYVRPVAWRGSEMISTSGQKNSIHMALACWEWPSYFDADSKMLGIKMKIAKWRRPPPSSSPFKAKTSAHYMTATLSKHEAEKDGFHDALMLDWRGHIADATSANIFFVKNDVLYTPIPDCFLNGITRQTVIELSKKLNYKVVEATILPSELGEFSECFLTGTAAEIVPVKQIDDYKYSPSEVCKNIVNAYDLAVSNSKAI